MDKLAKALGERIRMQRKACRISQDALALACSLDRSYVGRIERGEVNITVEKLYRIAGELACDAVELLDGDIDLTTLDPAYIAAVETARQRQCILGNPAGLPLHSDAFP